MSNTRLARGAKAPKATKPSRPTPGGTQAPPPRHWWWGRRGVFLVVAVAGASTIVIVGGNGNSGTSAGPAPTPSPTAPVRNLTTQQKAGDAWTVDVQRNDMGGLGSTDKSLLSVVDSWGKGTGPAADVVATVSRIKQNYSDVQAKLAKRVPLAGAPDAGQTALNDYKAATTLYLESADIAKLAAEATGGQLQRQLRLSFTRTHNLADRLFFQGEIDLGPYCSNDVCITQSELTFLPPPDVPRWSSMGYAAGPPLSTTPAKTPDLTYQTTRPQEPLATWLADVAAQHIPTGAEEAAAITSLSADTLRQQGDTLVVAANALTDRPDPTDDRALSTRIRLAMLVDSEATRAAQAATLVTDPDVKAGLIASAKAIALTGDSLWDARLGERSTGFPASDLTAG